MAKQPGKNGSGGNKGANRPKRRKQRRAKPKLSKTQLESPETLSPEELEARRAEMAQREAREKAARYRSVLNESARLLRDNRPAEAIRKLQPLQEEHPGDPEIAINLGGAYILQRKWRKAVEILEKAAAEHPENAMVWTNLAAAYLGRLETAGPQHQKRAIAAYEKALQADPNAPNVHYHLGLIHKERGDLNRAAAHFQRALEVNAQDKDARYWLDRIGRMLAEQQEERAATHSTESPEPGETAESGEPAESSESSEPAELGPGQATEGGEDEGPQEPEPGETP